MKFKFMGASALVLMSLTATQAFAQAPAEAVDTIVVTGTRTTGLKAVDSAAPVQVLGNDILKRVGQPDLVQSLAQNIPSLQAQTFGSDQAQFNKSFKLRGVSPNETLVLVNGERRHGTGNVNVAGGAFGGNAAADLNY
ncbi:MAG: TonB-dependent receptor, partial [Caulobacteraceae bacterium]|nr:TonB-dependent receptor [Caulobacteraceae bacterium]